MSVIRLQPGQASHATARRRDALDALNDATQWAVATVQLWRKRHRERNQLAALDARMLNDIGLSRADRDFLVNKPFWRE